MKLLAKLTRLCSLRWILELVLVRQASALTPAPHRITDPHRDRDCSPAKHFSRSFILFAILCFNRTTGMLKPKNILTNSVQLEFNAH